MRPAADMPAVLPRHSRSPLELKREIEAERRGEPFLLYRDHSGRQRIVSLADAEPRLTIGRGAASAIRLDDDREVSSLHAELERVGEHWVVVDDGLSHNGSYLNAKRVFGRRRLRDGDTLRVGATLLVYRSPGQREAETTQTHRVVGGDPETGLSDTQRRVLLALCRPLIDGRPYAIPPTNREIAHEVFLSEDRVKAHLRALFERFDVERLPQNQKRMRLAERALESGVVSLHALE